MNKVHLRISAMLLTAATTTLTGTATAGGAGAPASGQVLAANPAAVAAALRSAGYQVTMRPTQPDQDPSMSVKAGNYTLDVWLSGCQQNVCSRVTASTSWDYTDNEDGQQLDIANEWNSNYYTQAYLYEGSYYLDSTMQLRGGYTKAALLNWFKDYLTDVKDFEAELP